MYHLANIQEIHCHLIEVTRPLITIIDETLIAKKGLHGSPECLTLLLPPSSQLHCHKVFFKFSFVLSVGNNCKGNPSNSCTLDTWHW